MAAASRAERSDTNASGVAAGGGGWGLEVCISLKMLNPEGKEGFRGRREFEELLRTGGSSAGVGSSSGTSPPAVNASSSAGSSGTIRQDTNARRATNGTTNGGPVRANGSAPMSLPNSHNSSSGPTSSLRPSPVMAKPQLHPSTGASSSSRLSLPPSAPPSSTPMAQSSSNGPMPSRSSSFDARPALEHHSSSLPPPPEPPQYPQQSTSYSHSAPQRSRKVTPPPPPHRKSPPPSTPSRRTLHDLLRSDGKMSPELAKQLASNPMLLRLLKAVPSHTGAASSLNVSSNNPSEDKPSPAAETPTPSTTATLRSVVLPGPPSAGCSNCGAMESDIWRTKVMKDGATKKVCNGQSCRLVFFIFPFDTFPACGLYFNTHKRMRPPDQWNHPPTSSTTGTHTHTPGKKARFEHPEIPVRSSPRRHRPESSGQFTIPPPVPSPFESPKKRGRPSSGKTPQRSPRMATRSSARIDPPAAGVDLAKAMEGSAGLFFPSMFSDSPSNVQTGDTNTSNTSGTGPSSVPSTVGNAHVNDTATGAGAGMNLDLGDIDIEAFLNQITNHEGGVNFNLDALFGSSANGVNGEAGGNGDGNVNGEEGIMQLLNAWEDDSKVDGQPWGFCPAHKDGAPQRNPRPKRGGLSVQVTCILHVRERIGP